MRWLAVILAGTAAWELATPPSHGARRLRAPNPGRVAAIGAAACGAALLTLSLTGDPVLAAATGGVVRPSGCAWPGPTHR